MSHFKKIYAIDTNIILNDAYNIFKLSQNGENLIVIPETVLDEVDSKKSGLEEINFQAREFGRLLYEAKITKTERLGSMIIVHTNVQDCEIRIISKELYEADSLSVASNIRNDRKILEITKDYNQLKPKHNIVFISLDVMARIRAISYDIPAEALTLGADDDEAYDFVKELIVQEMPKEDSNILDIDPEHNPENFSYVFKCNGYKSLAVIKNEKIEYLNEEKLRKQYVAPANLEQLFFSNAMLDSHFNILTIEAKAGSGKTLLAISAGMSLVKDKNTDLSKIVYIRNSIESLQKGEEVGFLSGNDEKFAVYNHPLYDSIGYIAQKMIKQSNSNKAIKEKISEESIESKVEELVGTYNISTMWPGEMRGRTISNSFVVIDEAQNMSNATLQLILSRIDETSKVIVLGSNRQIDNKFITKYINGLTTLMKSTKKKYNNINLFAIELKKVLRGPITEFAEEVFSK